MLDEAAKYELSATKKEGFQEGYQRAISDAVKVVEGYEILNPATTEHDDINDMVKEIANEIKKLVKK